MDAFETTHQMLLAEAKQLGKRYRIDPEELLGEFWVEVLTEQNAPQEFCEFLRKRLRRVSENTAKRQRRFMRRNRVSIADCDDMIHGKASIACAEACYQELKDVALATCRDEIDRDLVYVFLGEHTKFHSKADVFRYHGITGTQAYRLSDSLESRLRCALENQRN